jgi:hypothetical protein
MALYNRPHDPRDHHDPTLTGGLRNDGSTLLPMILAAAIVVVLITMFYPGTSGRVDTNNAPSVQTVTPSPSPSTAPLVPTPIPTTEPRPTQAPIQ